MSSELVSLIPRPQPPVAWRLSREVPAQVAAPVLDPSQQRVVDHARGALLVLAGPGTGKTTTLAEAVAARLTGPEALLPREVLVLTFARKAAGELRERIIARVGGSEVPAVSTFHSLALSIVREYDAAALGPIRLLSGPEQEMQVREILSSIVDEVLVTEKVSWPETLRQALSTRGLTVEIRNALARAQSLGIGAADLLDAARRHNEPEWVAVAHVLEEYLDVIDQQSSLDYNELISRAVALTSERREHSDLIRRYRAIYVDEYQDTDPQQIELLKNLAAPGTILVAVGDPDQSIYGFRGADSRAVRKFQEDFDYLGADISVLNTTRRFGHVIRDAAYRVIERNPLGDMPLEVAKMHRNLNCTARDHGLVDFTNFESAEAEAEEVAEKIRELVASSKGTESPLHFRDFAILVRAGSTAMPALERALRNADIPVDVSFDDVPLAQEPSVATLLLALEASLHPERLRDVATAFEIITSPLGAIARADIRALALGLKKSLPASEAGWSDQLVANALIDRTLSAQLDPNVIGDVVNKFRALQNLLGEAADLVRQNRPVADVLWHLWSQTAWPEQLRSRALAGSSRAHRDLDAVSTLFDLARSHRNSQVLPFVALIRGLVVAADEIDSGHRPDAVALLTAHRSKGLQWPVVFVCGADEGVWPDIKRRTGIFQPDKIQLDADAGLVSLGALPERSEVVAEERRLFFVACTRAQSRLYVSSTTADAEAGRSPSRFVTQLIGHVPSMGVQASATQQARYSTAGLVAQLRRVASDSAATDDMRTAAAVRLAYLASLKDDAGRPLVPAAHPSTWWGTLPVTESTVPIDDPTKPVYARGSSLQTFEDCSLSWFMSQRALAAETKTIALSFGTIVHAFAQAINEGSLDPSNNAEISALLDQAFSKLQLDAPWSNVQEQKNARACIDSFIKWRSEVNLSVVSAETDFRGTWDVTSADGHSETVVLRGQIDMLLVDTAGSVYIADLKTNGQAASAEKTVQNKQLALYQTAVSRGLVAEKLGAQFAEPILGGAVLLFVRKRAADGSPTERHQPALAPEAETGRPWIEDFMATTARRIRAEDFVPTVGDSCTYCVIKTSCPLMAEGRPVIS